VVVEEVCIVQNILYFIHFKIYHHRPGTKHQLAIFFYLDPHFRTYDGTKYDFHGQCDLVMARSPEFGSGLGLDLHARTEIVSGWSLISNAALRIGEDVFELANDGSYFINGNSNVELPFAMSDRYTVTKEVKTFTAANEDKLEQVVVAVDLNDGQNIVITLFKSMISVQVNAALLGTEGMLGMQVMDGMVGRDRETILTDANEMGAQWQVTNAEPMLFRDIRAPQYPETCVLPIVESRRLRHSEENKRRAESVCASVDESVRQFCFDDVLLTGDFDLANGYAF
jgi:von Willebrand factor type D domain